MGFSYSSRQLLAPLKMGSISLGDPWPSHASLPSLLLAQLQLRLSLSSLWALFAPSPASCCRETQPKKANNQPCRLAGNPLGSRPDFLGNTRGFGGVGATVLALGAAAAQRSTPSQCWQRPGSFGTIGLQTSSRPERACYQVGQTDLRSGRSQKMPLSCDQRRTIPLCCVPSRKPSKL
jgi:hypothetical protein